MVSMVFRDLFMYGNKIEKRLAEGRHRQAVINSVYYNRKKLIQKFRQSFLSRKKRVHGCHNRWLNQVNIESR